MLSTQVPQTSVCTLLSPHPAHLTSVCHWAVIEVRFKDYGLKTIEVIDNGNGIAPDDYESIGKLQSLSRPALPCEIVILFA